MHKSKLVAAVIDCQVEDLTEGARFWSGALGREVKQSEAGDSPKYAVLGDGNEDLMILLQKVSHPSRVHLDIETDNIEAEVARLEALGARRARKDQDVVGDGGANRTSLLRRASAARWKDAGRCQRVAVGAQLMTERR